MIRPIISKSICLWNIILQMLFSTHNQLFISEFVICYSFTFTPVISWDVISYVFSKWLCFYNLSRRITGICCSIVLNCNLSVCTNISKSNNSISYIRKCISSDYNSLMVYGSMSTRLYCNCIMTCFIKYTICSCNTINMLSINTLETLIKCALINSKVPNFAIIILVIVT